MSLSADGDLLSQPSSHLDQQHPWRLHMAGSNLTTVTIGTCTVVASQSGNVDVNAANNVQHSFSISLASQTITFGAQSSPRNFSTTPFAISPVAFATSALPIAYSTTTPSSALPTAPRSQTLTAGTCTIAANQGGNQNYAAAIQVTQNVGSMPLHPARPTSVRPADRINRRISISPRRLPTAAAQSRNTRPRARHQAAPRATHHRSWSRGSPMASRTRAA